MVWLGTLFWIREYVMVIRRASMYWLESSDRKRQPILFWKIDKAWDRWISAGGKVFFIAIVRVVDFYKIVATGIHLYHVPGCLCGSAAFVAFWDNKDVQLDCPKVLWAKCLMKQKRGTRTLWLLWWLVTFLLPISFLRFLDAHI